MSVVLLGPPGSLGRAVFDRLVAQGDEVRVVEDRVSEGDQWKARGAYVAVAQEWDYDLIERASWAARTIVVFDRPDRDHETLLEAVVRGATRASVGRIIVVRDTPDVAPPLAAGGIDYAVLGIGKRSLLRRSGRVDDERVAEAVDAADDVSGSLREALDLTRDSSWARLGLGRRGPQADR